MPNEIRELVGEYHRISIYVGIKYRKTVRECHQKYALVPWRYSMQLLGISIFPRN